ncbi:hypothetical protein LEN26_014467 [Aphanomyces euteiches]|nr:hypothetical protein LEN26_014467 [Aphanomyces euteiches]
MLVQPSPLVAMKTSITSVSKSKKGAHLPTQYTISVADKRNNTTQWLVHKRYSDFRAFRTALLDQSTNLCGSCAELADEAPVSKRFPGRKWIFSNNTSVINERKEGLALFLDRVNVAVRNCGDPACAARPLLGHFLMLPDMRYTFIDMQLEEPAEKSPPAKKPEIMFIPPPPSLRHSFAGTTEHSREEVPQLLRHTFHGSQSRSRRHSVHISSSERIKKLREFQATLKPVTKPDRMRMSLETIAEAD